MVIINIFQHPSEWSLKMVIINVIIHHNTMVLMNGVKKCTFKMVIQNGPKKWLSKMVVINVIIHQNKMVLMYGVK